MALKRLDEEFELKPGTQLLPYMKRLLPSLEGRFQDIEKEQDLLGALTADIRAAALLRMNEILIPATEDIISVTKLGFLLAPVDGSITLGLGDMSIGIKEGSQRETFTPSPYLIIEHSLNDYALARTISYDQDFGILAVTITALHGNAGPWDDWMVSSTPGMADSTKLYHDAIAPMHATVVADTAQVVTLHQEILDAAELLEEAGADLYNYVRRDGTIPFTAIQRGVNPIQGSNDTTLATTAWSRARMIEYAGDALMKTGGTMTGLLSLSGMPTQPAHAASKAYVDSIIGQGGVIQNSVTLRTVNPYLRLQSTGTIQNRTIEAVSSTGVTRWTMVIADSSAESGGNAGSNWVLNRYSNAGTLIDTALSVNRATGALNTKAINFTGNITGTGNAMIGGEITAYYPATPTTGCIYFNQSGSAWHWFDGTKHEIAGGGLKTGDITCGALSTNGNPLTCWGMTSHGDISINGTTTLNGYLRINGAGSNMIELFDNDWGSMYIHHNDNLIGFLSNGQGWITYITNDGHIWSPQYGWLHDYVNGRAYAYYQSACQNARWAYMGDAYLPNYSQAGLREDWWGSAFTGFAVNYYYGYGLEYLRVRQLQMYRPDQGGWFSSHYT